MLAALVDGWPTTREVGQQSLPEIATRLTHRRDALSHEKSSIRVGCIVSSLPRLPAAERRSQSNNTSPSSWWIFIGARNASCTRPIGGRLKLGRPADDDGGDHDVQPVETVGDEEA